MPDENTNPVGTTQIPQDNQSTSNQSGDDFVLDFGEEENKEKDIKEVKIDNLEDEKKQEGSSTNEYFDNDDLNDNENTEASENNNEIQDENVENKEFDNDYSISLDSNDEGDEEGDVVEGNEKVDVEEDNDFNISLDEKTSGNEEGDEEGDVVEGNEKVDVEEDNDFNISLDEKTSGNEEGDEEGDEEEGDVEEGDEGGDEEGDEEEGDVEEGDEGGDEEEGDVEEGDEGGDEEEGNEEGDEEGDKEGNVEGDNDFNISLDEKTSGDNQGTYNDEILLPDDNENIGKTNPDDEINVDLNELEPTQEETDSISSNLEEIPNDNPNPLGEDSTNITAGEEPLNQPEIGDLLGNSSTNFLIQEPENTVTEMENSNEGSIEQEQNNLQENMNFVSDSNEENSMIDVSKDLPDNNVENQSFTLDYTNSNELEDNTNQTLNENMDGVNNVEISMEPEVTNINTDTNQIENTNQVESQQISTLSLDQILDTELNSNPKFSDNSKAVPINVSTNKGFFNKKALGVIAGIGLFVLVGVVVVSFPSIFSDKNSGTTVDGNQTVEEYVEDHQVANIEDSEENSDIDGSLEEDYQGDTSAHESNVTVDFPEADWDNDDEGDYESRDVEPYVSDEYDFYNEENEDQAEKLEIGDILLVISNYKSQAEVYYSQGDEMQDKKLVRYGLQAIHLCDNYQKQIENEESLDEESFSSFKSKVEKILTNAKEYLGGDNYNEFSQDNDYYEF